MSDFGNVKIGVVIPAYRVATKIETVLAGIPGFVHSVIVVEDASPDDTAEKVCAIDDPRITLIRHPVNQGVGGAMASGFAEAIRQKLDIVVKMDGDDQMDPKCIKQLIDPLVEGKADMAKGNRYHDLNALRQMPKRRILGNAGLTFLVKLASGYWSMFDPTNGYFAIRTDILRRLDLDALPKRYFFESGFLIQLGIIGAAVQDIPIPARYGDEISSLSIWKTLVEFPPRLCWGLFRRLVWRYFVYDFSAVSVFLFLGFPGLLWGIWGGFTALERMRITGEPASAGTVMLAAMPIILGFQMILQAIVVDIGNVPRLPLSTPFDHDNDGLSDRGDGNE